MLKYRPEDKEEKDAIAPTKIIDWASDSYSKFDRYVRLNPGDPIWMMAYKILFRIIGIVIMVAISPFILIGLLLAFLVVI